MTRSSPSRARADRASQPSPAAPRPRTPAPTPRSRTPARFTVAAFACLYFFWGSTYTGIHIAGQHLEAPLVGALRTLLTTTLLVLFCLLTGRSLRITRGEAWRLALIGVLMMSCNNVLLTWAETRVSSGISSLLVATMPIMVAVIEACLRGGERLTRRGWVGVALGTLGMAVLVSPTFHRGGAGGTREALAYVVLLIAALAFAVGAVLGRRFSIARDAFVVTAWEIGAAAIVNTLLALGFGTLHTAVWTRSGLFAIAYLAVFGSMVGLSCLSYLLQHVPVTKVATYAFVNPIVAVLLGVVLLGERLHGIEALGMAIIVASVALVIFSKVRQQPSGGAVLEEVATEGPVAARG
ncbi:MAG: EamA family transporter [Gluconacetobacter diazotrophicus]|nr:EamA family transporter [Gluconacetobacter diazotrophicus]